MNVLRTLSVVLLLCPAVAGATNKKDALPPIMEAMWVNKGMMEFCVTKGAITEAEAKVALSSLNTIVKKLDGFSPGLSEGYTDIYEKSKQGLLSQGDKVLNLNEPDQVSEQEHAQIISSLCKRGQKDLSAQKSLKRVLKDIDALMK